MQVSRHSLKNIIFTGLFAAIIYIGISLLRIPIPAMVGRPFIHFGNPLMVLAILFLGGRLGGFAAVVGLGGFDLLNGYAATSWLTALEGQAAVYYHHCHCCRANQNRHFLLNRYRRSTHGRNHLKNRGCWCLFKSSRNGHQFHCHSDYRAYPVLYASSTIQTV